MNKAITNWAKTIHFRPKEMVQPTNEEEIIACVKKAHLTNTPIKVCGKKHSYNGIFQSQDEGILLDLSHFNVLEDVDLNTQCVTFQAGLSTIGLIKKMKTFGLTIPNLGTNIKDNYVGACQTGYHGSGMGYGIQATHIQSFDIITATGKKLHITKQDPLFEAMGVSLGALGIIIRITIKAKKRFNLALKTKRVNLDYLEKHHQDLLAKNKHVKYILVPHSPFIQLWCANETDQKAQGIFTRLSVFFWDAIIINTLLNSLLLYVAYFKHSFTGFGNRLLARLLMPKQGSLRLESHLVYYLPHLLKQDSVEFAIPIEHTFDFLKQLKALIKDKNYWVQSPIELRFVAQDRFWMSPAYKKEVCYIGTKVHFLKGLPKPSYNDYFSAFNDLVEYFGGKPHWGKQMYMSKNYLVKTFSKWDLFWHLAELMDPKGLLSNRFLDSLKPNTKKNIFLDEPLKASLIKHHLYVEERSEKSQEAFEEKIPCL